MCADRDAITLCNNWFISVHYDRSKFWLQKLNLRRGWGGFNQWQKGKEPVIGVTAMPSPFLLGDNGNFFPSTIRDRVSKTMKGFTSCSQVDPATKFKAFFPKVFLTLTACWDIIHKHWLKAKLPTRTINEFREINFKLTLLHINLH